MLPPNDTSREIGPLPKIADHERRSKCERNFRLFCETYLAKTFHSRWSSDQIWIADAVESFLIMDNAATSFMPRGSGKSSLVRAAALWSAVYGHRRYVLLLCADARAAEHALSMLRSELATNGLLVADFPEVCHPIRDLDGVTQRAKSQLCNGEPTNVVWRRFRIALPTVAGSQASGVVIEASGYASAGYDRQRSDAHGHLIRPDLVLVDDPLTRVAAQSRVASGLREKWLAKCLSGMARKSSRFSCLQVRTASDSLNRVRRCDAPA